jgi:lysophospholipase L1-like esterase
MERDMNIVLLGDSILDNKAYVGGEPDVRAQVQGLLAPGEKATLLAVDGSVINGIHTQLAKIPKDATHFIISTGGNDLLGMMPILNQSARSVAEVLLLLADLSDRFQQDYRRLLTAVLARKLPTAICTIYYPRFPDETARRVALTALAVFNDCIIQEAIRAGVPLLDLRVICDDEADFANPIEPSSQGGMKIARRIVSVAQEHDFSSGFTRIYT